MMVMLPDPVNYGEDVAKALWEYLRLSDWLKVKWKGWREGKKEINDIASFWHASIRDVTKFTDENQEEKLVGGEVIRLNDFNFTEWFPWIPGRYWTAAGDELRRRSRRYIEYKDPIVGNIIYDPFGKTLRVLSGIGGVRLREHGGFWEKIKVLCATTNRDVSGGIPLVMSTKAYKKIRKHIKRYGTAKATIEGIYQELPSNMDDIFRRASGVPRCCLFVGSKLLVGDVREGEQVSSAAWTIFESGREDEWFFSYCYFDVGDENSIIDATRWIQQYVDEHDGKVITDFDEIIPRFDATIPIREVVQDKVSTQKINEIINKVRIITIKKLSS